MGRSVCQTSGGTLRSYSLHFTLCTGTSRAGKLGCALCHPLGRLVHFLKYIPGTLYHLLKRLTCLFLFVFLFVCLFVCFVGLFVLFSVLCFRVHARCSVPPLKEVYLFVCFVLFVYVFSKCTCKPISHPWMTGCVFLLLKRRLLKVVLCTLFLSPILC